MQFFYAYSDVLSHNGYLKTSVVARDACCVWELAIIEYFIYCGTMMF